MFVSKKGKAAAALFPIFDFKGMKREEERDRAQSMKVVVHERSRTTQ